MVKSICTIPGLSDHDIVMADCDIKGQVNKQQPRLIHLWSRADWNGIKAKAKEFCQKFLVNIQDRSVNENYSKFKEFINMVIRDNVPSKQMRASRHNLPWITQSIRRMSRKKQRLFNKAKRSHKSKDWDAYKSHKKDTSRVIRRAHWQYASNILLEGLQNNDSKPFWRYVKAKRQDTLGVSPLKSGGELHSDAKSKASILNTQFQSVFTEPQIRDSPDIPKLNGPNYPSIKPLVISDNGVEKILSKLQIKKACGPDNVSCRILRELAPELAPVLTAIFDQSLSTGEIPDDWSQALVAPIFKKGNRHAAANYRPVSLTSVPCKIFEHILCSHIRGHLDKHGILTNLQHGFRRGFSCESQLLITLQDLFYWRDRGVQVAKAFDAVPHESLLGKLGFYGIDSSIQTWIRSFLTNRSQEVVVDGVKYERVSVASGVPQGTVLGPLLFLMHMTSPRASSLLCVSLQMTASSIAQYMRERTQKPCKETCTPWRPGGALGDVI